MEPIRIGDCFYSEVDDTLYYIKEMYDNRIVTEEIHRSSYKNTLRLGYIMFSQDIAIDIKYSHNDIKVDSVSFFKLLKLLSIHFITCKRIIEAINPEYFVNSYLIGNHMYLSKGNTIICVGDSVLDIIKMKQFLVKNNLISSEAFERVFEESYKTLDLLDKIWNTFSESRENG